MQLLKANFKDLSKPGISSRVVCFKLGGVFNESIELFIHTCCLQQVLVQVWQEDVYRVAPSDVVVSCV